MNFQANQIYVINVQPVQIQKFFDYDTKHFYRLQRKKPSQMLLHSRRLYTKHRKLLKSKICRNYQVYNLILLFRRKFWKSCQDCSCLFRSFFVIAMGKLFVYWHNRIIGSIEQNLLTIFFTRKDIHKEIIIIMTSVINSSFSAPTISDWSYFLKKIFVTVLYINTLIF